MWNHSGSSFAAFPLPFFASSLYFFYCSFEHLYFAHSLTIDVSIAFLFPSLERDKMFSVCKWASTFFLIASKIWTFAYFLRVRVSKVDANSAWPSTRTDASTLSSPSLHFLLQDSFGCHVVRLASVSGRNFDFSRSSLDESELNTPHLKASCFYTWQV